MLFCQWNYSKETSADQGVNAKLQISSVVDAKVQFLQLQFFVLHLTVSLSSALQTSTKSSRIQSKILTAAGSIQAMTAASSDCSSHIAGLGGTETTRLQPCEALARARAE
jgi:hypothetical protein